MSPNEIIQLLRYDRHDLMNELQIIHGYLSIGKTDMVKDKLDNLIENYKQERELINSKAPHFALFILQANHLYENIRLTFEIDLKKHCLEPLDLKVVNLCRFIVDGIKKHGDVHELYHINIALFSSYNKGVKIQSTVSGDFSKKESIMSHFENTEAIFPLNFKMNDKGFSCSYTFII